MNDLCAEIGFQSINHEGEQLCGDHVEVVKHDEDSTVVVLADGLGSGVKASILSTLTSKIISTMMAEGMSLVDCVETIAQTLPICKVRGIAYSTFTILHIVNNEQMEIIEFDNPMTIIIRDGEYFEFEKSEMNVGGKNIYHSIVKIKENDVFIAMSDGCPHAGIGRVYNFGWRREDIIEFMKSAVVGGYNAKTLATILIDEVDRLYWHKPGDDATAIVIRIRKRVPMNILFGPPRDRDDCKRMMSLFFSKEGKHIICGGTTAKIAADYLGKTVNASIRYIDSDLPPIATIEGVDLVTEGVITVNRVVEYAKDAVSENEYYEKWSYGHDGASLICRRLFEEATDINFYVGRAVNPAHQNPDLPIGYNIKMKLVEDLTICLKKMGKRIKVCYF